MRALASNVSRSPRDPSSRQLVLLYFVFIKVACNFTSAWAPSEESSRCAMRLCAEARPRALRSSKTTSATLFMRFCSACERSVVKTTPTLLGSSVMMCRPLREAARGRRKSAMAATRGARSPSAARISSTCAWEWSFSMHSVKCSRREGMKTEASMPGRRCRTTSSRKPSTRRRTPASRARGTERKCVYSSLASSLSQSSSIWALQL
mmetsp:Transcript_41358/g.128553  ORF Transcript_41358/g.128553 Transcript_41358/m.128553 type:complete len:207 (-) Transcript_41358:229-849(-)